MRYVFWSLVWEGKYGYGPEEIINKTSSRAEPTEWQDENKILGYLDGDFDIATLPQFSITEISIEEALEFAKSFDSSAKIDGNLITCDVNIQN